MLTKRLVQLARRASSNAYARSFVTKSVAQPAQIVLRNSMLRSFSSTSSSALNELLEETQSVPFQTVDSNVTTGGFSDQKPLSDFDLSEQTLNNLKNIGITHLFPVQVNSFSTMMEGKDIVGRSKTGSGKTLAFALPIVEKLLSDSNRSRNPRALVLLPTRELSLQVAEEFRRIAPQLRAANIVGGVSYTVQENALNRGADIVIGTPGRIVDMMNKGSLTLNEVQISVLDESDMMLKFGFQEEVETILGAMPEEKQCVMWSATFPKWVNALSKKYLRKPVSIDLVGNDETHLPTTVSHKAIHVNGRDKAQVLESVLKIYSNEGQSLVFTETKQEADELVGTLGSDSVRVLHGDLSQSMRTATMNGFRKGHVKTLICTDIAARGLDIANVDLVVQYRLSNDKESFVHRSGRTGRAGRTGVNVILFDNRDLGDIRDLERKFGVSFNHVAAPHPQAILDFTMKSVSNQLTKVHNDSVESFKSIASKLYEEQGINALSSALALIAGFQKQQPSSYSMLTGAARLQTVEIVGAQSIREAVSMIDNAFDVTKIHKTSNDKFVIDVYQDKLDALQAQCALNNVILSPVEELPLITIPNERQSSPSSRFGSRNSNNNRRNNSYGGGNNSMRNRSNGSFRNNDRKSGSTEWGNNDRRNSYRNNDRNSSANRRYDSGFSRSRSPTRSNSGDSFNDKWL